MKNSISVFVLLLLAFSFYQCSDDDNGECVCPEIFSPVCGDDGIQYDNPCSADCVGVEYIEGFCPVTHDGLILDLGDPAVDGCGWVIELAVEDLVGYYRPDTLAETLEVDSLAVRVDYKQTFESSPCGMAPNIPVIEILTIEEL